MIFDFLLGFIGGISLIIHFWASEKAFGKWWKGLTIIAGITVKPDKSKGD